ncbi:hypothetical protein Bca4012_087837 [Brassica carinata]
MMNVSPYWKRDQVFITFRGQTHREGLVSFLTEKLETSGINYYVDYHETRGTEDLVRKKVDRGSNKSILETELKIWERRQALESVGGIMGFSYKHKSDQVFLSELVVEVKELLDKNSSPRNIQTVIEKPLMHPQEAVTLLLQALNLRISDLKDLIAKPFIHINGLGSMSTDHLVFLDLNSLMNPGLSQTPFKTGQDGKILLVLLGFLEYYNEVISQPLEVY